MREIIITENEAGQRLNKFLMKYLNQAPSSFIYKMLRKKNIKRNHKKAEGDEILIIGDLIQLYLAEETIETFRGQKSFAVKTHEEASRFNLEVVYQDENILVANKPDGVLSQKAVSSDYSMNEALIDYLVSKQYMTKEQLETFKPSVCNRLDRNTTGLIICSTSFAGSQAISQIIKNHQIDKYYHTVIKGIMKDKVDSICYLVKDKEKNKVSIYDTPVEHVKCEEIHTIYEPLQMSDEYTLLKVQLITGKSHQIRAHLKHLGYAIVGDSKYGKQSVNQYFCEKYGLSHQLLHCHTIRFQELSGRLSYLSGKEIMAEVPEQFHRIQKELFPDI